jgi:AAA ATPase domain
MRRSPRSRGIIEEALRRIGLTPYAGDIIGRLSDEGITIAQTTWRRFWEGRQNVRSDTFIGICEFLELNWEDVVLSASDLSRSDPNFYGREKELRDLQEWVTDLECRLVILYGLDGIGKSALVRRLREQVESNFEDVKWQTFSYGESVDNALDQLIPNNLQNPNPQSSRNRFREYLQRHRCLVILEHQHDGRIDNYNDYIELFRVLLGTYNGDYHRSCILLITSYEMPNDVTAVANVQRRARSLRLGGVDVETGLNILESKNSKLVIDRQAASELVRRFDSNPYALILVSSTIRNDYDCDVRRFLDNLSVFKGIDDILSNLIQDLERPARIILDILKDSEMITQPQIEELYRSQMPDIRDFTTALRTLERRSLVIRYQDDQRFFFGLENLTKQYLGRFPPGNT